MRSAWRLSLAVTWLCCVAGCTSPPGASDVVRSGHGRLLNVVTYNQGMLRFDPAPVGARALITEDQAVKVFKRGPYGDADRYSPAQVFLSAFTDYGGTKPGGGRYDHQLAWVVRHTGVPDTGSGQQATTELHDVVAVIDANAGTSLMVVSSMADSVAQPNPVP